MNEEQQTYELMPTEIHCVQCGSSMKVSSTRKQFRWYRCGYCGATQKIAKKRFKQ